MGPEQHSGADVAETSVKGRVRRVDVQVRHDVGAGTKALAPSPPARVPSP